MNVTPQELKLLTRQQWIDFLARHTEGRSEPLLRRRSPRYTIPHGVIRLSYPQDRRVVVETTSLLQVSEVGLTIKTRKEVPMDAEVRVEALMEDQPFALNGVVIHSTQTIGGFKTGVKLRFADAE